MATRIKETLGERLERLRVDRGLSKTQVAGLAKLREVTVPRLETGTVPDPFWSTVQAIAEALELDLGDLADLLPPDRSRKAS